MAINFFDTTGKTSSSVSTFGLCDDVPPAKNPAYIDEADNSKWIGQVSNPNLIEGSFYAIDNCIEILRPNGEMESRCDGMLHYNNSLSFIELKDRLHKGWLVKAREQLTITINLFKANHDISTYDNVDAYVCNKQRPMFKTLYSNEIQKFKDDTGLILNVQTGISI